MARHPSVPKRIDAGAIGAHSTQRFVERFRGAPRKVTVIVPATMRGLVGKASMALVATTAAAAAAGCGSTQVPEAATGGPVTAATVGFSQTGHADAHIQQGSITYRLDATGSLVVRLSLPSSAATTQTIAIRASLHSSPGSILDGPGRSQTH